MKCFKVSILTGVLVITLLWGVKADASTPFTCGGWSVVPSPNVGSNSNSLQSSAAASPNDVWAVGYYFNRPIIARTLTEHWNGTQWNVVPSPNSGTNSNLLYGVTALSTGEAWAVGLYIGGKHAAYQTLVEHWNGKKWKVIPSPNVGTSDNILYGIQAIAPNDIWAVGEYFDVKLFADLTLVEHWNGTKWSVIPSPNVTSNANYLYGVAVVSPTDVWAVGDSILSTSPFTPTTLIEQWNGSSWSIVTSPNPPPDVYNLQLRSVADVSPSDIWTVGSYYNSQGNQTLIEHWDGTQWSIVPSPNPGSNANTLSSVTVVSASDVWAVGTFYNSNNYAQTLIEQWDGTSWDSISSPNPDPYNDGLLGVIALSANDIWAVGSYGNQTLTEFYC